MALYINVVVERWREKVHWDVAVESANDTANLSTPFIKLSDLENIVLLASVLRQHQVIVAIDVEVHVVGTDDLGIDFDFVVADYLDAHVLVVQGSLALTAEDCAVAEIVHALVAVELNLVQLDTLLQLASVSVPSFDFSLAGEHAAIIVATRLVKDWRGFLVRSSKRNSITR